MAKGKGRRGGSALMASGSVGPTSMIRSKAYTGKGKRGAGWWDDLTGWVKKNKLVSKGLKGVASVAPGLWGTAAQTAGTVADSYGWGRRKRRR
jgi:hypothetical protein